MGSAAPGRIGSSVPLKIAGVHRDWLIERIRASAFTLRGLVAGLTGRGLSVDYVEVRAPRGSELHKNPCWPANRIDQTSHANERGGSPS
jgi:putative transposase